MKKNTKYIGFIASLIFIAIIMLAIIFSRDSKKISTPSLTAIMSVDRSILAPEGKLTNEEFERMRKNKEKTVAELKNKAIITIHFKNNSDKRITDLKVRIKEVRTTDPNNFIMYEVDGLKSYEQENENTVIFKGYDRLEPHYEGRATLIIWPQSKGSSTYEAEIISREYTTTTNAITITSQ